MSVSVDTSRERIEAIAVALNRAGFQSEARAAAIVVLRALLAERDAALAAVARLLNEHERVHAERDAARAQSAEDQAALIAAAQRNLNLICERDAARAEVDQYRVDLTEALLERDAARAELDSLTSRKPPPDERYVALRAAGISERTALALMRLPTQWPGYTPPPGGA